ncbi:hypothetical protein HMPREF1982_03403 [Clostridiales bacterium oral taxon 876 str. F0540]|nr:hypothetical protein HMPREF1982_03403 [Clostridiales bacterium oral taxon 876 str. F0540]
MKISYYDNNEIEYNEFGVLNIDRVYCLDFNNFSNDDWSVLADIYRKLPNQIILDNMEQQMWFGTEGGSEFYLWSSVEPSGLQIVGHLREHDWKHWEKLFHEKIERFPFLDT